MAENEDVFATDSQAQIILSRSQALPVEARDGRWSAKGKIANDEEHPLLPRQSSSRASALYKPWTAYEGLPWYKKPSIFWLLAAYLPFCLSWGGLIVPKTYLVLNLICQDYLSDRAAADPSFRILPVVLQEENKQCRDANVQSLVARFQLYAALLSGIFSAVVSPYLGALSDRVGRRKVIAFSTLGSFVEAFIYIMVGTHPQAVSVYWLLLGFLLDGLCGSFTSVMGVSLAYASDCTPPERRNVAIGYFHGTLFTGMAFGPILAGLLMKWAGTVLIAFYVAVCCHIFFITFLLAAIPESLSEGRQLHARERHRIKKQDMEDMSWWLTIRNYNLFEPLAILRPKGPGTSDALRRNLSLLAAIDTIMFGVAMGAMSIILIYPQYVFGWDPIQASSFLSIANICRVTSLLVVLPLVTRFFRGSTGADRQSSHRGADMLDIRIVRIAILLDLIGYAGYATAMTSGMMVASAMIAAFAGIGSPTLSSAITAHVPPDRTGQVLGALGLLHALARVVSPTIFNTIYGLTVGKFTPAVFVCLGSLFLVVFVLSWFLKPGVSYEDAVTHPGYPQATHESAGTAEP